MKPLDSLRKNVGRALIQSQFSGVGRDSIHYEKSTGSAQHFLVPQSEQLPRELVENIDDLTDGILGRVLGPPKYRGTVLHVRELPVDWEAYVTRSILESFVLQLAGACEWFIREMRGEKPTLHFIDAYPVCLETEGPSGPDESRADRATNVRSRDGGCESARLGVW